MRNFLFAAFILLCGTMKAQNDLEQMADSMSTSTPPAEDFVHAAFKGTKVINFPSLETVGKHVLDFRVAHRFADVTSGPNNAFGLDGPASIRLSFDYGITDWLQIGIGRSSLDKLFDGSVKVRILRQKTHGMPLSLTMQGMMNYTTLIDPGKQANGYDKYKYPLDRVSYATDLVIGRKFSEKFSFEINGFWVHYNLVDLARDKNDMFAAGFSARYKLTAHFALTCEYGYRLNRYSDNFSSYYDPIGIGFDLETGGHVFQVHFTNAMGMNEAQFIPYNSSNWVKGSVRLGFNLSRVFTIGHHTGSTW